MDPNQLPNPTPMPPPSPNPYDFITKPGKPPKKPLLPFLGGNSMMKRLFIVLGGAVIFMIIAMIVVALLGSGGSTLNKALKDLAVQQEELVRIADLGVQKAAAQDTRSLATTTKLSVASQQQRFEEILSQRNIKISKEERAAGKDEQVDEALEAAASNNRFDEAFLEALQEKLTEYNADLEAAYKATSNQNIQTVLSDSFTSTAKLLGPVLK